MIFSLRQYRRLQSRLRLRYQTKWKHLQKAFKKLPPSTLQAWIKNHPTELSQYSSTNWFFQKQLETYVFLKTIDAEEGSDMALSQSEEKVFDTWNHSEFADVFLKNLNKRQTVQKASQGALKQFEEHLLTLGKRHIEKVDAKSKSYRIQTALGERLREGRVSPLLSTTLHLEGKELGLSTPSLKEMEKFSRRIEMALRLIRIFSPSSWERFVSFTDTIVPIRNKEFVSYSHQDFPGVSMINLYDRDFVDLLDDLLHENGHHHLNHYLNLTDLIEEPAEMIYYSPWRRTLRPLRGIYHAYFTFFWAFKLFSDLAKTRLDNIWYEFSDRESEKILWRAVEEFHMLNFTFEDLRWAKDKGLISTTGWELISTQQREIRKHRTVVLAWERKLGAHKKDLKKLKSELKLNRKLYEKN